MTCSFECGDCFAECLDSDDICVECGADLTVVVEVEDGYEDDGQPSEIQEWHDFDPDC
jgi:hypothetical protein